MGMPITFELQIINNNSFPISMDGFFYENVQGAYRFSFSSPTAVHLISPNGEDLFVPYKSESSAIGNASAFTVDSESEEWVIFSISQFQHLRQAGEYSFWVELQDNLGTIHKSNIIYFEIQNIVESIPSKQIELALDFESSTYSVQDLLNLDVAFEYTFTNNSPKTITLLRQQTGVNLNLVNPMYEFTIIDDNNRLLPIHISDATLIDPVYDEESQITLQPGESFTQKGSLPHFPGMRIPGKYLVQLTYIVHEIDPIDGTSMKWGSDVFRGLVESNKVILNIEE